MAEIIYRPACAADLERTYEIFVTATNGVRAQRNLPLIPYSGKAPPRSMAFRRQALAYDSQRFWVAESNGTLIGFGVATLRESLWYLAALHVWPGFQNQGIGRRLLQLCLSPDNAPGAQTWIVISDSLNPDSNALYAKHGMYQWVPLLSIDGRVPANVDVPTDFRTERLKADDQQLAELDALDRQVLGVCRRVDHQLWLVQRDLSAYSFHQGGHVVGYAYLSSKGEIGPVAVREHTAMAPVLAICLRQLQEMGVAEASFKIPATCHNGVDYLLRQGFRYHNILLLDASQPFGRLENYLVSVGDALF